MDFPLLHLVSCPLTTNSALTQNFFHDYRSGPNLQIHLLMESFCKSVNKSQVNDNKDIYEHPDNPHLGICKLSNKHNKMLTFLKCSVS